MEISFDPAKRERTLRERQLDFLDAPEVFAGHIYEFADHRFDYGEETQDYGGLFAWADGCHCVD